MVQVLIRRLSACALGLCLLPAAATTAAELGGRHTLAVDVEVAYPGIDSDLGAWPEGGFGKLRFGNDSDSPIANRIVAEYNGRIAPTLWSRAVLDYVDGGEPAVGLTEAYLDWRPVPRSANQHRFRFGAFYPAFSLENGGPAWSSPFTNSFSAINAWYGEEVRPIGAEWTLKRHLGYAGSPHEISVFAAGFYGNDPAGTLLFWRGFAVHDRQTRLNERLPLPPLLQFDAGGNLVSRTERRLDPIAEIDDEPGFYGGVEWRYARRALLQLAHYDNRADPYAFRDGQWGWDTRFTQLAAQFSLPAEFGLVMQWMRGSTDWLTATTPTGLTTATTVLASDKFDARFLLLTRRIGGKHRVSLRHDRFDFQRPGQIVIDDGHAWTVAYEFAAGKRLTLRAEWLEIESTRDLWPFFYGLPDHQREAQLQIGLRLALLDDSGTP